MLDPKIDVEKLLSAARRKAEGMNKWTEDHGIDEFTIDYRHPIGEYYMVKHLLELLEERQDALQRVSDAITAIRLNGRATFEDFQDLWEANVRVIEDFVRTSKETLDKIRRP